MSSIVDCAICGQAFAVLPSKIGIRKHCSRSCRAIASKTATLARHVALTCPLCGTTFYERPNHASRRRYCSPICQTRAWDTRIPITCERCGKVVMRPRWHRQSGWLRSFCSRICSRAPHTADFIGTQPRHAILWDRIATPSPDLAYWLGLMITDGSVSETGAINFVSLDACSTQFVRDFIAPSCPIREERTAKGNIAYRWTIWSKPLGARLGEFGIIPRKSLTARLPNVPPEHVPDLLRGILDGDGSVDSAGRASFSTGSRPFADDLATVCTSFGWRVLVYGKKRSFCVLLNVPSSRQFAALVYRDDAPHLARKRARFH